MKRPRSDTTNSPAPKRLKLDNDPFAANLERSIADLYESNADGAGFIRAKAFMVWPIVNQQLRIQVRVLLDGRLVAFEVSFSEKCAEFFGHEHLHFDSTDEFLLCLRDAQVQKKKPSGAPANFPIALKYAEGVVVKFLRTLRWGEEEHVVDTWKLKEDEVDWFRSPPQCRSPILHLSSTAASPNSLQGLGSSSPRLDARSTHRKPLPTEVTPVALSARAMDQLLGSVSSTSGSPRGDSSNQPSIAVRDMKKEKPRHFKMARREKKILRIAQREGLKKSVDRGDAPFKTELDPSASQESENPPEAISEGLQPPQLGCVNSHAIKVGLKTETAVVYTPLSELTRPSTLCNVIGVLVGISEPAKARSGSWHFACSIVDPTCYSTAPYDVSPEEGFKLTCFSSNYEEWLPTSAKRGDVLILYQLKTTAFNGTIRGLGYHDRLKWAIYSPSADTVHHGDVQKKGVPRSEGLDEGFGLPFSPFHDATPLEISYCKQLSRWWDRVTNERAAVRGDVIQVGQPIQQTSQPNQRPGSRKHRTVSEADPDAPPSGYFDCTVEVLYGELSDVGNVYSLFVTDYTPNQALYPVQADWAPPGLADSILKIEMWDAASAMGPTMEQGKYYSIKNLRAKTSRSGYLEAKLVETKIMPLREGSSDIYLKQLFERKQYWQQSYESVDGKHVFPHSLIQNMCEDRHFTCTVEVLHVDPMQGSHCFIYVTDYTPNALLHDFHRQDQWACGHESSVMKIQLSDDQAVTGRHLEPGFFCELRNLKVKRSSTGEIRGYLGGDQRLIMKLQTDEPKGECLNELLERKRIWALREPALPQTIVPAPVAPPQLPSSKHRSYVPIREASRGALRKFCVLARVIDFWPIDIRDFVVLYCSNCNSNLPISHKACFECGDSDHEYVQYHYRFFLRLQDECGDSLEVAITHKCPLINAVKQADLHEDEDIVQELTDRLSPYVGNLSDVHDSWRDGTRSIIKTPYYYWTISSKDLPFENSSATVYYLMDVNGD